MSVGNGVTIKAIIVDTAVVTRRQKDISRRHNEGRGDTKAV